MNEKEYMSIIEEIGNWSTMPESYMFSTEKVKQLYDTREEILKCIDKGALLGNIEFRPSTIVFGDVIVSFKMMAFVVSSTKDFTKAVKHLSSFGVFPNRTELGVHFSGTLEGVATAFKE